MRTLIIYASREGLTDRIARRISKCVCKRGFPSDLVNVVEQLADRIVFNTYDAVVIGSPVDKGHYDSSIRSCIEKNRSFLSEVPTAFFSVRLGIAGKDDNECGQDCGRSYEFLQQLRWQPSKKVSFGGVFRSPRVKSLEQRLMRWLLKEPASETDVRHNHQHIDWDTVDDFATRFAEFVDGCKQPKLQHPTFSFPIHRRREYSVQNRLTSIHANRTVDR